MQPSVSILIPVYNVAPYLRQCMDSVVGQTLQQIEIICVNDGSTDDSLAILRTYAEHDARIQIIDKENGGYGMAMNVATDHASGEYIGIVEPDDFVSLSMFEELYQKAKEHDLDLIKSDFHHFSTDAKTGAIVPVLHKLTNRSQWYNVVFDPSETPEALRFNMHTWTGIYKRSFLEAHQIRYHETPGAAFQDNGFWFQTFVFAKRAMIVAKPYYMYRDDNPFSSIRNRDKVYAENREYDHIRKILMRYPDKWERFKGEFWYRKYANYMFTLDRIRPEFRRDYIRRISDEFRYGLQKREFRLSSFRVFERMLLRPIIKAPSIFYLLHAVGYRKVVRRSRLLYDHLKKESKA